MPFDEPPDRDVDLMAMDGHQEYVSLPNPPINRGRPIKQYKSNLPLQGPSSTHKKQQQTSKTLPFSNRFFH